MFEWEIYHVSRWGFIGVERWTDDNRASCVGFMHNAACVAKGFQGETLGITVGFRALCPGVTVAVQAHPETPAMSQRRRNSVALAFAPLFLIVGNKSPFSGSERRISRSFLPLVSRAGSLKSPSFWRR